MSATKETTVTMTAGGKTTGPVTVNEFADHVKQLVRDTGATVMPDGELFDAKPYQTPLPTLDGHRPDTIKLQFGAGIEVDLKDGRLVDYLKTLRLGTEVGLYVTATVAKVNWAHRSDPESGEEKVTHTVGLAVHTIDLPEEL